MGARSFDELGNIMATGVLGTRPRSIICGAFSGLGGTKDEQMNHNIHAAAVIGVGLDFPQWKIFDQRPFQEEIRALQSAWREAGNERYCQPVLDECYGPLFATQVFTTAFFIPGWWTSIGAKWEREKLASLECVIVDLTHTDIHHYLRQVHEPGTNSPLYPEDYLNAVMARIPRR